MGSLLVIVHFSFTFSSVLPRRFCIIIGDGIVRFSNSSTPVTTVRCYRSRHNILAFLIFHLGKALAFCQVLSWTFHEFCANFPSSGSNLGGNQVTCFDFSWDQTIRPILFFYLGVCCNNTYFVPFDVQKLGDFTKLCSQFSFICGMWKGAMSFVLSKAVWIHSK